MDWKEYLRIVFDKRKTNDNHELSESKNIDNQRYEFRLLAALANHRQENW